MASSGPRFVNTLTSIISPSSPLGRTPVGTPALITLRWFSCLAHRNQLKRKKKERKFKYRYHIKLKLPINFNLIRKKTTSSGRKHERSFHNLNPGPVNIKFSKVLYQFSYYLAPMLKLNL